MKRGEKREAEPESAFDACPLPGPGGLRRDALAALDAQLSLLRQRLPNLPEITVTRFVSGYELEGANKDVVRIVNALRDRNS